MLEAAARQRCGQGAGGLPWLQGQGMASGVRGYLERRHRTGTPTEVAGVNKAL